MKKDLSSLDIHYMLKELNILIDQKLDKIYHPKKEELILQFHVTGKGKTILKIIAGKFIYLTEDKEKYEEPSGFCMFLRKHLDNARLRSIRQLESERIIELEFEKKDVKLKLIIELFGNGNILVVDEQNKILSAIEYHIWKDRAIKPKEDYHYPQKGLNLFNLKDIKDSIQNSNKDSIVKTLAIEFGLGGTYAEEVCFIAGVDKNLKPVEVKNISKIKDSVSLLLKKKLKPTIIYKGESYHDVTPFDLKIYAQYKKEEFLSFSSALDKYLIENREIKKTPKQKQIEKLQKIKTKQEEKIQELRQKEVNQKQKAETIYQNYKLIDEILTEINKATKKYSWQEIKEKLKGHKIIKELNVKDKKIKIELNN